MKKFVKVLLSALVACVALLSLFGCGESKIDGRYEFANAGAQEGGGVYAFAIGSDKENPYQYVVGGFFVPEHFWVEIKGSTMTIHGSVDIVGGGNSIGFNMNEGTVRTIENFKLVTSTVNKYWYDILDSKGEDTLWKVLKDGKSLVFEYGKSGTKDLWYNISYNKAES